jgi:hypothetical protein
MSTRNLYALSIVVLLVVVGAGEANATSNHHTTTRSTASVHGITLPIKHLSRDRATVSRIARYYYGSKQMSFVIYDANPWLDGSLPTRSVVSLIQQGTHTIIRIPCLAGVRPIGPC